MTETKISYMSARHRCERLKTNSKLLKEVEEEEKEEKKTKKKTKKTKKKENTTHRWSWNFSNSNTTHRWSWNFSNSQHNTHNNHTLSVNAKNKRKSVSGSRGAACSWA